jgi:hypothetical protein
LDHFLNGEIHEDFKTAALDPLHPHYFQRGLHRRLRFAGSLVTNALAMKETDPSRSTVGTMLLYLLDEGQLQFIGHFLLLPPQSEEVWDLRLP